MLPPLNPPQFPIAGTLTAVKEFYQWLFGIDALVRHPPLPNLKTANYILAAADAGGFVEVNVGAGNTLTVPKNATVPIAVGWRFVIVQVGAGQTVLTATAGVTVHSRIGLKCAGQWAVAYLYKRATDEWVAS